MRRKRKLTPEAATGYHEAGHAVVSFFLRLSVKRVTIEPTGETLGHTEGWSRSALWANLAGVAIEPPLPRAEMAKALGRAVSEAEYAERRVLMEGAGTGRGRKPPPRRWSTARLAHEVQREIMVLLAGGIAEKRASGRHNHVGAQSDREKAADLALHMNGGGEAANAYLRWLSLCAAQLVNLRWQAIEAVAAALLAEKTLDGKRLGELILAAKLAAPNR